MARMRLLISLLLSVPLLSAQIISTSRYVVANPATFPLVALPAQSVVFVNGAYKNKGTDYKTPGGNKIQFSVGVLANGDTVDVVSINPALPVTTGIGLVSIVTSGFQQQISLDTTIAAVWVPAPTRPGPCSGSNLLAVDALGNLYTCAPAQPVTIGTAWPPPTTTPGGAVISGSASVGVTAVLGASQITLTGMNPSGTILAGDAFTLNGSTYTAAASLSDVAGTAILMITPPLAQVANPGDSVVVITTPVNPFIWARVTLTASW